MHHLNQEISDQTGSRFKSGAGFEGFRVAVRRAPGGATWTLRTALTIISCVAWAGADTHPAEKETDPNFHVKASFPQ